MWVALRIALLALSIHGGNDSAPVAVDTLRHEWTSANRGQLLFVNGRLAGLDTSFLCVMRIPGQAVHFVPLPDTITVVNRDGGPLWGGSRSQIIFYASTASGQSGIFATEPDGKVIREISENVRLPSDGGTSERIPVTERSGYTVLYDPPSFSRFDRAIDYQASSGSLFIVRYNSYNQGPLGWRIDPDTLELDEATRQRLRERMNERRGGWYELWKISVDGERPEEVLSASLPGTGTRADNMVVSLSVSESEPYVAYSAPREIHVLNLNSGEVFSPVVPEGFSAHHPRFSPDGTRLAACAFRRGPLGGEAWSILVADGPQFKVFQPIWTPKRLYPMQLSWSPDAKWIIAVTQPPVGPEAGLELYVIEVGSGKSFMFPKPYFLNGRPHPGIYPDGGIDWAE